MYDEAQTIKKIQRMIQDKKFLNETIKKSILSNIPMQDVCNGKTSENRNLKELK